MREVLFKNLMSTNGRKKDTFLREEFEKNGVLAKAERRYFYFIMHVSQVESDEELQGWINKQNESRSSKKRHFYILKIHSDQLGEDRLICKVAGIFYAVTGKKVYTIAFMHSFKVCFSHIHV